VLKENALSLTSDLISAIWTNDGELTKIDKKKLRYLILSPLSASSLEMGFRGPKSDGFFERIKESVSKLPSHFEAQLVLERKLARSSSANTLFPDFGLETRIHLFETELPQGASGLGQLCEDLGLEVRPGKRADYISFVRRMLGQDTSSESLVMPDLTWEEDYLKSSSAFVKAASLTDLPLSTWNNAFEALFQSADEFLCSIKLSVPDKAKSRKDLEAKRRVSHALSVRKAHELSDLDSGSNLTASEEILVRITQGKEALLNMSLALFMSDEDLSKLESRIQAIVSEANGSTGAGVFIESLGTLPVLRAHMPGAKSLSVRELPILSGNLAHLMPFLLDYGRQQEPSSLKFVSRCGEVSHLNFFSGSTNNSFNSFLAGASGSGKSFLVNSLLAGFRADHHSGSVAIFDVGGSYRKLVKHLGGVSLDLNPKTATELIATSFKRLTIQSTGFCKTLLENICGAGYHITHSHKVAIEDLLQTCSGAPFSLRTISNEAAEKKEKAYEDIVLWLRPYLHWDHVEGSSIGERVLDERVRAFDFKNLEADPLLQRLTILILTQGIWDRLKANTSGPTLIVFDEVWKFFSHSAGFLEEMYRTLRKYRSGIASCTQAISDYGDAAFARVVITNSFHQILLQGAATAEALERVLDLDESDRKRALGVASKKNEFSEFWLRTPKFSQVLRLYPSKALFELANSENIQTVEVNQCA
jgi:type IV secretory pathway VirB4 component